MRPPLLLWLVVVGGSSSSDCRELSPRLHSRYSRTHGHNGPSLQEVFGWSFLRFSDAGSRPYIPENCIFTGVTVWRDKVILSVPRFSPGVPATLTWLPLSTAHNPPLQPFPSWTWQDGHENNCSGLVSVFRTRVDRCGRLWAMDSGRFPASRQLCPPRLVVFDLERGRVVRSVIVPQHVLRPSSLLTFIVLDMENSRTCDDMFIYITDAVAFGLVVFDVKGEQFWRFEHYTFNLEPQYMTFTIAGEISSTEDGVIALAISYIDSERMLFYHALASISLYAVPTAALRRPSSQLSPVRVLEKTSQGVGLAAAHGTLFFNPLADTTLVSWCPQGDPRVLLSDVTRLQFLSDINADREGELWAVSNRFQSFDRRTYNPRGTNLRLLRIQLPSELRCKRGSGLRNASSF